MCVCVRDRPIFNFSIPDKLLIAWDIHMKFDTPVKQS